MNKKAIPMYFKEKEPVTIVPATPTIIEITVEGIISLPKNIKMLCVNFILPISYHHFYKKSANKNKRLPF